MFFKTRINPKTAKKFLDGRKQGRIILNIGRLKATIYLKQSGAIRIEALSQKIAENVSKWTENIGLDVEIGQVYQGLILSVIDFGAFVAVVPYREGMLHASNLSQPIHSLDEGNLISVEVIEIGADNRIRLSTKEI